ncbi:hypothetical protein ACQP3J_31910, partial [Escherichia coli]
QTYRMKKEYEEHQRKKCQVTYKCNLSELHETSPWILESQKDLDRYSTNSKRIGMPTQTTITSKAFYHYRQRKQDIP